MNTKCWWNLKGQENSEHGGIEWEENIRMDPREIR
jgi:hypothetical protein